MDAERNEWREAEKRLAEAMGAYVGEWIAVKDQQIVAHGPTYRSLFENVEESEIEIEYAHFVVDVDGILVL